MAKRGEVDSIPLSKFGVLVAQLESIAASARQQPPDPLLCFDLLSELVAAIDDEPKESIQQWQRKCEEALYSLLILGARRPVRRLASLAMGSVIAKGDGISVYSRVSSLQGWLVDSKRSEPQSCSGAAQCLGELYHLFGRRIASGLVETTSIAAKLLKFHEDFVRQDALQLLENALQGSGGGGASTAYSEAFRIIMRVGVSDKSFTVRLAAARCLKAFASIGGPGLGITDFENSIAHCVKALEDPVSSVRDAFAEALGALLALAMNPDAQVKQKGKNHPVATKKLEDSLQKYLISPFTKVSGVRAKNLRIGLALSWVFFLQVFRLRYRFPDVELQEFSLQIINMLQGNASVDAHALACVLYVLRVGVTDQMTEPTQRSFLVLLGRKLELPDYSPSVGVATLRILSYLLKTLGEVPVEFRDILDDTVVAALSHSSMHVRTEAALTLRSLAEVDPTCVGGLISYAVTTLHALRESFTMVKGSDFSLQLHSLHGQAAVLASLVFISPKLVLGYPARLPKAVFEVSKKMLTEFSRNPVAATVEKEAGWLLLASLIASMPKEELEDQVFDVLLLWADPFLGNPEAYLKQKQDLNSELRVLIAGIEALTAFIKRFISPTVATNNVGVLLQPVMVYLSGALSYISSLSAKPLQNIRTAFDLFTIRTLLAYQSVSDPLAYRSEHSQILQICSTPFGDPSGSEESSCLRFLLDKRDACLGPWIPGRDWFEDELRAFDGGKDGLAPCLWDDELDSFPQPVPISKLLVNEKLMCLATIFASQDNGAKLMLLNKIDQCLKTGKKQPWHVASITNACVALLSGLKVLIASRPQTLGAEILSSVQSIFLGILADNESGSAQRRASSEGLGLLARLANDIFTARMMRTLLGELVAATDPSYVGSIAFSLGCIHRSAGGMALSSLVPATVSSISLLAKSSNAGIKLWTLHALLLTIEAAGLSYISQVQAMLFLAMEILLSEENGLADLRQELGRLVNAIVAVLGPELVPGSTFFSRCKSFIAEISSCKETSSLVEAVRFTQQLVLFAPQAVSVHSNVESLLPTLSSRQPSLRYLAVSTLQHLIEKDPAALVDEKIEENLFSMLNEETDSEIGSLVRTTLTRLLYTSCPSCPSRWLAIFHKMVLATSTMNASQKQGNDVNTTPESGGSLFYGEDDEGMISNSNGKQMKGSHSAPNINFTREKHLRYRTRMFAAECLSYLPTAVGTDLSHFDLTLARAPAKGQNSAGDWLVLHLQELVSLAYQISTGPFEGMQPIGVRLLSILMDKFGNIQDPELPGHLLLEQYQAQLFSAARSAVNMSSSPLLLEAGLQLATKISTSSIISGDRVALNRMFSLISRPLDDIKDLYYPSFAEWVACKIKIRLLAAHASFKCYVYQFLRGDKGIPEEYQHLTALFSSSSTILGKYWIGVLRDYLYICFCLLPNISYKPFLDGIQSQLVSSKLQNCLEEAWPMILKATALDAVPVKFKADSLPESNPGDISKNLFISGYSMVKLELCEYQLLWGLALLVLFQGKQAMMSSNLPKPVLQIKREYIGDSTTGNINVLTSHENLFCILQSLSSEAFFCHKFLTSDLCHELLQVLIYTDDMPHSWDCLVVCLLSQIVRVCPESFFEAEDFTAALIELYCRCFFITLKCNDAKFDVQSELSMTAETIALRMKPKKIQLKLIMAFMSTACESFRRASTDLCLPRIISFLQKILPLLKKVIRDASDDGHDSTYIGTALEVLASMLLFLAEECIRRSPVLENQMGDSSKLLAKFLAFCLEESIALARSVCEILQGEQEPSAHSILFTVFDKCTKCMRDTLYKTNMKVQTVGLHVLKSIAQRELAEGTRKKNMSFFTFLIGEFVGDIFHLIQHTLKEHISRETASIIEECLRLLLLFYTLSKESECSQGITMLLLEALLMVFSVSSEDYSQEMINVKNIVKKLVSHLVQIPSFAVQIKDVMLSMPVSRRQQLQDMIRASVAPGQNDSQAKFNVQPQPSSVTEVHQSHGEDVANQQEFLEEEEDDDDDDDGDDDDDDDWDAFQSLPATASSGFALHADITESKPTLVSESSPLGDDDHQEIHLVSEDANDPHKVEDNTEQERTCLDQDESTSLQSSDENDEFDEYTNSQVSVADESLDGEGDRNSQLPDEHLPSPDGSNESNGRHLEGDDLKNIGSQSGEAYQKTDRDSSPANEGEDFQRPADSLVTGEGEIAYQKPVASKGGENILRPSTDSSPISEADVDSQNVTADSQLAIEDIIYFQKSSPSDDEENIQKFSASEDEEYLLRPANSSPTSIGEVDIEIVTTDLELAIGTGIDLQKSSPSDGEENMHESPASEGEEHCSRHSMDSLPGIKSEVGTQIVTTDSQFAPGGDVDNQKHYASEGEVDNQIPFASEGEEDYQKPKSDSPPAVEGQKDFGF